jgi:hypothetical protein
MSPSTLFNIEIQQDGLKAAREVIRYADIRSIYWRNLRLSVNFVPAHEVFCILIRKKRGLPTVLFRRIKLSSSVYNKTITNVLKTGLKVPNEKEAELTNYRSEFFELIRVLEEQSTVKAKESRWLIEEIMELYSYLTRLWTWG